MALLPSFKQQMLAMKVSNTENTERKRLLSPDRSDEMMFFIFLLGLYFLIRTFRTSVRI